MLLLKERLRRGQWVAVSIGAVAVVVLTVDYGRLPWIALTLAASFGTYGLVKKTVGIGSLESLAVETALLFSRSWPTCCGWRPAATRRTCWTAGRRRCC